MVECWWVDGRMDGWMDGSMDAWILTDPGRWNGGQAIPEAVWLASDGSRRLELTYSARRFPFPKFSFLSFWSRGPC